MKASGATIVPDEGVATGSHWRGHPQRDKAVKTDACGDIIVSSEAEAREMILGSRSSSDSSSLPMSSSAVGPTLLVEPTS